MNETRNSPDRCEASEQFGSSKADSLNETLHAIYWVDEPERWGPPRAAQDRRQ